MRMHEKLRRLNVDGLESMEQLIGRMTEDFAQWIRRLDGLVTSGMSLPPLEASRLQDCTLEATTSIQTSQINVGVGDSFTVTDASKPNFIKIRTEDGNEDHIPILTYLLQSSDDTIDALLKRLLVQLLSLWTDCVNQSGKFLHHSALKAFHSLKVPQSEYGKVEAGGSAIISRLKKFGEILKQAEVEQVEKQSGKIKAKNQALTSRLLRLIAAYQKFFENWNNFRLQLKARKPEPICIFETLDDLKKHTSNNGRLKCFTTTFTVESTEIREETTHMPMGDFDDDDASSCGGGGYWGQLIETEQLTSVSQEEKKRYIVKAVKDPRSGQNVSLKEAIQERIIDMQQGIYRNPVTEESVTIAVALSDGKIQIDRVTKTRSVPKTEALGLIKVRDRIGSRSYTITAVVDALTAERVSLTEAKRRGLLDEDATVYTLNTTGEDIPMQDAVDSGWVLVEYDPEEEASAATSAAGEEHEFQTKTYAVRAVVDQRLKKRVPFLEAVQRKLVDRESGNYYNNLTGETVHALEAIRLGFLKASVIEDSTKMDIDPTNKMVVHSIGKMKSLVTGFGALSAMKESANRLSTSSVDSA